MKLALTIVFLLCVVSIDAKRKKDGNRPSQPRNGDSSPAKEESGNDSRRKPPNHKGYKSKYPFPLFKSCLDFNVEYAMRRKELKRNHEIWAGKCKTGEEMEQEMCKSQGISSIRCSLPNPPSKECMQEINNFLNGISCDEAGEGETEDSGIDIDDTATEGETEGSGGDIDDTATEGVEDIETHVDDEDFEDEKETE
ncbi:hypothetical protein AVEN_118677-1 [Araneus ventricosus]|uniref:Secreted protein n=1 Tax=Araneus ventricosus TaxID=182803 RepID=A0A4Y2AZ47_ARAVE|nr:hypothetical protein AVEN_118677-1 [Araneus ventricosus]